MSTARIEIAPGFSISRIVKGNWQLSQGHSALDLTHAVDDMFAFAKQGVTAFDCADIYSGVEEMIGQFLKAYRNKYGHTSDLQVLTKFVPDLDVLPQITKGYVEKVIDRSLTRLGVEQLDMVQFSWWNYAVPKWIETAHWLMDMKKAGKVRYLGATNFNTAALQSLADSGIRLETAQVQYSLLDNRPEKALTEFCSNHHMHLLCYGTVAGGFLSEHWLGVKSPEPPLGNRSLIKYRLIIDEFGGWDLFQALLQALKRVAVKHHVSISNVAVRYILERPRVGAAIIGARHSGQLAENLKVFDFSLSEDDHREIESVCTQRTGPPGDAFDIERIPDGPHGKIMRYNLNQVNPMSE